ncbi:helix-turn-helix domain-containing protein [Paenibacillus sp. GCM10012307]|uniref:Helix-turn-helix transcriptional regulator n=1 Tax=Paenibacillus roseus TaxID=2798579 RepID=A0A934MUB3_9BACL|nr:helix-turn-helix transcriptional regulator [Paenibacillus roseus]MBJ6360912.1 helix-turn-helix transcriptional regulator [Paenibacillus roseus]
MVELKVLVGNRLRQIRKEKGLTQLVAAERAELEATYLAGVEQGRRNISLESLEKIVKALEVEPIEAFRFGALELNNDLAEKRDSIRLLSAFLEERSMEEIELIRKLAKDVTATIDIEKRKKD